jgi:hypothetical protein
VSWPRQTWQFSSPTAAARATPPAILHRTNMQLVLSAARRSVAENRGPAAAAWRKGQTGPTCPSCYSVHSSTMPGTTPQP